MPLKTMFSFTMWALLLPSIACHSQSLEAPADPMAQTSPAGEPADVEAPDETSVKPGINDKFIAADLDVESYVKKFEIESREVYLLRDSILTACEMSILAVVF